jgi:2-polyprenyl-3-methyl-5-hydroxy-6-metoxy-1,4-benzoquinol methylase
MGLFRLLKELHKVTFQSLRSCKDKNFIIYSRTAIKKNHEYCCKKFRDWEKKDVLKNRACPLCNSTNAELVIDKSNIDCQRYTRCLHCGFVFTNPFVEEEYYNELYETGYGGLSWEYHNVLESTECGKQNIGSYRPLELIEKKTRKGTFLDFGCGSGWVLKLAKNTYDVCGVDLDKHIIQDAVAAVGDDIRIYYLAEFLSDESQMNKYDIVHVNQVVEHLLDPLLYLNYFYKWLRPGGILFVSVPVCDSFAFSFLGAANRMTQLGHVSFFSKKTLTKVLVDIGFEDISFEHIWVDVSATEFWKKILKINFVHRLNYIDNKFMLILLYPFMLVTTAMLHSLTKMNILKGNYCYVFARKPGV